MARQEKKKWKKDGGLLQWISRPERAHGAAACDPSTVGSGQWSLLCEASLTPFLPLQARRGHGLRHGTFRPLHNLEWAGQLCDTTGPGLENAPNILTTLMPPLGWQAHATELGESRWLGRVFKLVFRWLERRGGAKQWNRREGGTDWLVVTGQVGLRSGSCHWASVTGYYYLRIPRFEIVITSFLLKDQDVCQPDRERFISDQSCHCWV